MKKWGREDVFKDESPSIAPQPQAFPTHILSRFFLCGASTRNQQGEGAFFGSSVGMGSASVGRGRPLNKLKAGGQTDAGSASNSEFSWAFCLWLKNRAI